MMSHRVERPPMPLGMDRNKAQECFADSFLLSAAGAAGCTAAKPGVDDDSIDWTLSSKLTRRPKLDVQMKSTIEDSGVGETIHYSLKRKNYDDLTLTLLSVPRILVLVILPREVADWLNLTPERLLLRKSAYWLSLTGFEPTDNAASVTVPIPRSNLFTPEVLTSIMQRLSKGETL